MRSMRVFRFLSFCCFLLFNYFEFLRYLSDWTVVESFLRWEKNISIFYTFVECFFRDIYWFVCVIVRGGIFFETKKEYFHFLCFYYQMLLLRCLLIFTIFERLEWNVTMEFSLKFSIFLMLMFLWYLFTDLSFYFQVSSEIDGGLTCSGIFWSGMWHWRFFDIFKFNCMILDNWE